MKKEIVLILVFALIGCTIAALYPQTVMLKVPGDPETKSLKSKGPRCITQRRMRSSELAGGPYSVEHPHRVIGSPAVVVELR